MKNNNLIIFKKGDNIMESKTYVRSFLDYIQTVYYSSNNFSKEISDKIIFILKSVGKDNIVKAINFFYDNNEKIDTVVNMSGIEFKNEGQKLSYILGIWFNSYNNGCVYTKRRTNNHIVEEVL